MSAYNSLNSFSFFSQVLKTLEYHNIDLCLPRHKLIPKIISSKPTRPAVSAINRYFCRLKNTQLLGTRFEFSMMAAKGGSIVPHTDSPNKLITLVFSMNNEAEWDPSWGGGTSVLEPKDLRRSFNYKNQYLSFDDCNTIKTFPFNPYCFVFVKTFNSLHAVYPMTGPNGPLRKTLTVNIEYLPQ